ncbi:MAG: hypothetical protein ACKORY_03930 [Actinomycetota bacterium]
MRNLCERPGCGAPADASYGIDRASLSVWVNVITVGEREITGRLCRRHANALTVPHGWTLDDRRDPNPKLFRAADFDEAAQEGGGPARTKTPRKAAGTATGTTSPKKRGRPKAEDVPSLFEALRRELDEPAAGAGQKASAQEEDAPATAPDVDPDETQAIPWSPRLGRTVEYEDGEEKPRFGRLLGRAFGEPAEEE